jgi:hypothetical protein
MSTPEQWIENAESNALFLNEGEGDGSGKLLEISPSNRTIANRKQAVILATLRFAGNYYRSIYPEREDSYKWIHDLCDNIEEYQLTMDGEQNSRRQFIKVQIAHIASLFNRDKNNKVDPVTK